MSSRFVSSIRSHPEVLPVMIITAAGASFGVAMLLRAANKTTDVSFRRKSNPHPWQNIKSSDNFKLSLFKVYDYSKVEQDERPKYE